MLTIDYILNDVKALKLSNTIGDAKKLFNELIFTHIPVVENGNLYGLIAESDLPSFDDDELILEKIQYTFQSFFTFDDANWFDLLKKFSSNETNIIPVLNKNKKYVGYFELIDVLHFFNNTPFLQDNGNLLIVSKKSIDYSISEIAQITESNNAKLLGVFISKIENDTVEITLKITSKNINDVIHSFRRYDYKIILGIKEDEYLDDLKQRSDYLQKYLSI